MLIDDNDMAIGFSPRQMQCVAAALGLGGGGRGEMKMDERKATSPSRGGGSAKEVGLSE